jgi:glycosyltransferase involved in cell wall biosynthesis
MPNTELPDPARAKKHICIVTPCYNEEGNVRALFEGVKDVFAKLDGYTYEHIFIDNASRDATVAILRDIAHTDKNVKIIVNARNFGHIRSPYHAVLQAHGDAVITLVADLQDPPAMIPDFLHKWEEGYKVVLGVKTEAEESRLMYVLRSVYYKLSSKLSDVELVQHVTGFGLFDRRVVEVLRQVDDPYPYFRGLIADIGFESYKIPYRQPKRKRGITKNNFYTLYDLAMLGITNHSKVPLRVATMAGLFMSAMSLGVAFFYLIAKLIFWDWLTVGTAPLLISLFFFSSVQLFFLGMLGEYIGAIHTQVQKRPLVIESERVNFEYDSSAGRVSRNGSTADRGVVPARKEDVPGVLVS